MQTALADRAAEQVSRLSGGNRQRVNIAVGLLGAPSVLLLDEPTSSLDPLQRERLWDFIIGLRTRGTTVLFSTHNVFEAERYADRVLVLVDGELRFTGTPDELQQRVEPAPSASLTTHRTSSPRSSRSCGPERAERCAGCSSKDVQILRRSPLLVGMLVVYPIALALMIGFALSSPPGKPKVAFYSGITPSSSHIHFGSQLIDVNSFTKDLYASVQPVFVHSRAAGDREGA